MPSRIPPGTSVAGRLGIYRKLSGIPSLRSSYARKFAIAAFVGAQVPLVVFIAFLLWRPEGLMQRRADRERV